MGVVVGPMSDVAEDDLVIQWLIPPLGPRISRGGRWKDGVDIFGKWRHHSSIHMKEAAAVLMPGAQVRRSDVLMGPIGLDDCTIMYTDLDILVDEHGIDITGLTWTRTKNGSVHRNYRLMTH